jgi:hypothetical protein
MAPSHMFGAAPRWPDASEDAAGTRGSSRVRRSVRFSPTSIRGCRRRRATPTSIFEVQTGLARPPPRVRPAWWRPTRSRRSGIDWCIPCRTVPRATWTGSRAPERRADPGVLIERSAKIGIESFDPCDVATTNVVAGPARHSSTPTTVRNWALAVCGEVARIAAKAPKRYEERVIARAVPMEGRRDCPRNSPSAAIAFENGIGQARQTDSHM